MAVVLALRALGLGDLLTGVPALRALRRAHPADRIVLAAPPGLAPLARLTGAVDAVLPQPGLDRPLATEDRPSLAVNLHGRGPRSTDLLRATRPGALFAFGSGSQCLQWTDGEHEVDRWCRLLADYGVPADRFAAVAAALRADGHRVVASCGPSERDLAAAVGAEVVAPDLVELAALVAGAALVVCGDTGVGHLATAYGTPSVLLFGPTPPTEWGPRGGPHTVLWTGGRGDPHGNRPDPGLLRIPVAAVIDAARRTVRAPAAP